MKSQFIITILFTAIFTINSGCFKEQIELLETRVAENNELINSLSTQNLDLSTNILENKNAIIEGFNSIEVNKKEYLFENKYYRGKYFYNQPDHLKKGMGIVLLNTEEHDNLIAILVEDILEEKIGDNVCFQMYKKGNLIYAYNLNQCENIDPQDIDKINKTTLIKLYKQPIIDLHYSPCADHIPITGDDAHFLGHIWPALHVRNGQKVNTFLNSTISEMDLMEACYSREPVSEEERTKPCELTNINYQKVFMNKEFYNESASMIASHPNMLYITIDTQIINNKEIYFVDKVSNRHEH